MAVSSTGRTPNRSVSRPAKGERKAATMLAVKASAISPRDQPNACCCGWTKELTTKDQTDRPLAMPIAEPTTTRQFRRHSWLAVDIVSPIAALGRSLAMGRAASIGAAHQFADA